MVATVNASTPIVSIVIEGMSASGTLSGSTMMFADSDGTPARSAMSVASLTGERASDRRDGNDSSGVAAGFEVVPF